VEDILIEKWFSEYLKEKYGSVNASLIDHFSDEYYQLLGYVQKMEEYEINKMAQSIAKALGGKKK